MYFLFVIVLEVNVLTLNYYYYCIS